MPMLHFVIIGVGLLLWGAAIDKMEPQKQTTASRCDSVAVADSIAADSLQTDSLEFTIETTNP